MSRLSAKSSPGSMTTCAAASPALTAHPHSASRAMKAPRMRTQAATCSMKNSSAHATRARQPASSWWRSPPSAKWHGSRDFTSTSPRRLSRWNSRSPARSPTPPVPSRPTSLTSPTPLRQARSSRLTKSPVMRARRRRQRSRQPPRSPTSQRHSLPTSRRRRRAASMRTHDNTHPNGAANADNRPSMPPHPASEYLLRRWDMNDVQTAFAIAPARFSFYVGGVGAGKTTAGAIRAILRALKYPGSLGLIGAPTYPMLHDATERTFFEILPPGLIAAYHKSTGHLTLASGSEILFRSLDAPDSVRGLNLAWFWLDEAPLASYYAWQILKGRLRQRGVSTAAWATGTPRGRDGFWLDFEERPRPSHALFRAATHINARNLPPDYIAELGYSGAFALQEIEGLFVAFEGLVYSFDATPQGHLRDPRPDAVWPEVIGGIDWGFANPTAALVFGLDGDGRAWQLDEFYQRRAGLEDVVLPAILELTRRYQVRRWYCGPDEPEHITALAAALAREGLPALALKADNAVRAGIQTITGLLAVRPDGTRGLYVAPRCVHTIAEYGSYQ